MTILQLDDFDLIAAARLAEDAALRDSFACFSASLGTVGHPDYEHHFSCQTLYGLIDKAAGQVIGSVNLYPLPYGDRSSDSQIAPSHQGQGYGSILLAKAIGQARQLGCSRLTMFIDENNEPSWRRVDKLVAAGFACLEGKDKCRFQPGRTYRVFTRHPLQDFHAALAVKSERPQPARFLSPRERALQIANSLHL